MSERQPNIVTYQTEFGRGWVAFDEAGIVELGLPGRDRPWPPAPPNAAAADLADRLGSYWRGGPLPEPDEAMLGIAATTTLLREIYREVIAIPAGETRTYGEVAERVGRPGAARAVGAAMARNPFAPVIPCHRVVGSDGSLRGYGGGLDMKRFLLALEASDG